MNRADLLLEGNVGGEYCTVVLTWHRASKVYEFHSAHVWTKDDVCRAPCPIRQGGIRGATARSKKKDPIQKAIGSCSAVTVFEPSSSGAISGDPGDARAGGRSHQEGSIAHMLILHDVYFR